MDRKIVLELDRKVADQQSTLEKAGVAGFYVTTNPQVSTSASPVTTCVPAPEGSALSGTSVLGFLLVGGDLLSFFFFLYF